MSSWFPKFESDTLKSVLLDLSQEFLDYLTTDGMVLPKSICTLKAAKEEDYGALADDWDGYDSADDEGVPCPEFPILVERIKLCLADWGAVVPRSNWTVPQDAAWIIPSHSAKCTSVEDIFLLIKASSRLAYDYGDWQQRGLVPPVLALRKWYGLERSMEFRCFVVEGHLEGISQKHCTEFFAHLQPLRLKVRATIASFWERRLRNQFDLETYTVDVYLQAKKGSNSYRVFIVSFGIFGLLEESPCLFEWDELRGRRSNGGGATSEVPLRLVENPQMGPSDAAYNALPHDLRHADFDTILQTAKDASKRDREDSDS
eukprot:GGOE01061352.1.p1 GENE.GGOE01061352.1~~GGOE01061352.1.p1  ORF type:complete len:343 (+),score=62.21 GGOE01061352.1:83-1030(+)